MNTFKSSNSTGGYTDSRGEWRPENPISFAPIFVWPPKLTKFLIWLFNYLLSWNLIYLGIVLISYYFLQPPIEEMKTFKFSWIAIIFIRNMTLVWIIYGGWHLYLYQLKKRGTDAKYCPRWQSTNGSTFLWNDQVYDNVFWACASAVPLWTAYEVLTFWLYANNKIPYLDFREHPVWFIALFLLIPFWRELHFYFIHRLIHWKPLYKKIHYLHHYNINPGPWSGLAMHPVEHLLYFSVVLIHWIVPSHPLHFLFNSQHTALSPAPGHTGYEGKIFKYLTFGSYFHYLHHRLFECNYGESTIPLDKWFGIFEDGSLTQTEKNEVATKYQKLEVIRIVQESPEVKSFYLTSADRSELKQNIAGQHLTFRIPFKEKKLSLNNNSDRDTMNFALRSYTISNNAENNQYRISVKKETNGHVSGALHNSLQAGDVLEAKGPKGMFVLKKSKRKTRVFIAAGIGITPVLSMLHSIKKSDEEIFLIVAAKSNKLLSFKAELQEICSQHQNIRTHVFFSKETTPEFDKHFSSWRFHEGRLNIESLKLILPEKKNFSFYICGPRKMNETFTFEIDRWTGGKSVVHSEIFGVQNINKNGIGANKEVQVHFTKTGTTVTWDNEHSNILEFAESNGISLEAGCMFGECGACSTKIDNGEVAYNFNTAVQPAKGNCLPCSCHPTSDIFLDA